MESGGLNQGIVSRVQMGGKLIRKDPQGAGEGSAREDKGCSLKGEGLLMKITKIN